jgi:hypothetical protein
MATARKAQSLELMSPERQALVRKMLRDEFADFFTEMTTSTGRKWPNINDQEMVNAIADALILMGKRRSMGTALLQTLVHELQDRVNDSLI